MCEILLMVLGSITLATVYSMITDSLVGSRLRKLLGGKPMPKDGHVVVIGMGHVGMARKAGPEWAGLKPSALRAE